MEKEKLFNKINRMLDELARAARNCGKPQLASRAESMKIVARLEATDPDALQAMISSSVPKHLRCFVDGREQCTYPAKIDLTGRPQTPTK